MKGGRGTPGCKRDLVPSARLLRIVVRTWNSHGMTLEQASSMAGVDKPTLWRWMAGNCRPDPVQAFRLETLFGISARGWYPPPDGK